MWDCPDFLDVPGREHKPRARGITHALDKGMPTHLLEVVLDQCGSLIDVLKIGWGLSYVDPKVKERISLCAQAGVPVCLGGTLLEVCAAQGRVADFQRWAAGIGVSAIEVSNGLRALSRADKTRLIRQLSEEFVVYAETGAKSDSVPVVAAQWQDELAADLDAGATWLVTEGRESGTVGLYEPSGSPRADLVAAIIERVPVDRVIFEAPRKAQQAWLIDRHGPDVNLGNVALDDILPLETLRLGLRADTARCGAGR